MRVINIKEAAFLLGLKGGASVLELIRKGKLNGRIENNRYVVLVDEKLRSLLDQDGKDQLKRTKHRLFQNPYYKKRWPRLLNQISR